jgi:hypothetical protein
MTSLIAAIAGLLAAAGSLIAALRANGIHKNTKTSNGRTLAQIVEDHVVDDAAHFAAIENRWGMPPIESEQKKRELEELKEG